MRPPVHGDRGGFVIHDVGAAIFLYSSLVDIDEQRWRTEIAPLIERMRSLPDPSGHV
jgi:hypothetical protein